MSNHVANRGRTGDPIWEGLRNTEQGSIVGTRRKCVRDKDAGISFFGNISSYFSTSIE